MISHTKGTLALLVLGFAGLGCELILTADRTKLDDTAGTGGAGGEASTSGANSSGGPTTTGGIGGPCLDAAKDCPILVSECGTAICDAKSLCAVINAVAKGTPVTAQTVGDCQKIVCDGKGSTKSISDNTDLNDDSKECTTDSCVDGMPVNKPAATNSGCGLNKKLKCNAAGECVGCVNATDCGTPPECKVNACNGATCSMSNAADASSCGDSNACTQPDSCHAGLCKTGSPVLCTALDECHDVGTCILTTGTCSNPTKADGSPCAGGAKTCTSGLCF
jgi:hypothetical protein